jgi:ribose transport system substrate-binding protein
VQLLSNQRRFVVPLIAVAAAAAATLVAGCGGSGDSGSSAGAAGSKTKTANIAVFGFAAANAFTQVALNAAKDEAGKSGSKVTFFDGKFDPETQYRQVQDAVASGQYNSFLIMPNDGAGLMPVVKQAIAKNIKVAAQHFAIGPDPTTLKPQVPGLTTTVGVDIVTGTRAIANKVVDLCKDKDPCGVVVLYGDRGTLFDQIIAKETKKVLKAHPNVRIVTEVDASYLRDKAASVMRDVLASENKNDIDVVVSPSSDQAVAGAQQVLDQAGLKDVQLIGNGGSQTAIKQVRAGRWAAEYVHLPASEAREIVKLLVAAVNGKKVPDAVSMDGKGPGGEITTTEDLKSSDFTGEWDG